MDYLNQYFSEHDFPDWFGDYYLEDNNVYVSLVDLNSNNKLQVQRWAKSEDVIFQKARFSYNYLNSVLNSISEAIENEQITFISSIWIDSKSNQIKVSVNGEITDAEKKKLYSYDKKWKGDVFDVDSVKMDEAQKAEADIDTMSQVNQKVASEKPLQDNNSQIIMKAEINRKGMLRVEIQNVCQEKISFGAKYQLYIKSGNDWKEIDYLPNVGCKDLEYSLEANEIYLDKVDLRQIFGELETGKYKIEKEVSLQKSRLLVSSEFNIVDS